MFGRKKNFPRPDTGLAPQPVEDAPSADGDQPGLEGPLGIIGVADRVDGQKDVLNRILDILRFAVVARCQGA